MTSASSELRKRVLDSLSSPALTLRAIKAFLHLLSLTRRNVVNWITTMGFLVFLKDSVDAQFRGGLITPAQAKDRDLLLKLLNLSDRGAKLRSPSGSDVNCWKVDWTNRIVVTPQGFPLDLDRLNVSKHRIQKLIGLKTWPGSRRRNPSIFQLDYLISRSLTEALQEVIRTDIAPAHNLQMLDVGCGGKPYYPFFERVASEYVGVDVDRDTLLDVASSSDRLPFRDGIFDVVLSTQALEHMASPAGTIDEAQRVLKDGGLLLLSAHGVWPIHDYPRDYWRFTEQGLLELTSEFSNARAYPNGGSLLALFQIINLMIPRPLGHLFYPIFNLLGRAFDRLTKRTDLAINYLVVARK